MRDEKIEKLLSYAGNEHRYQFFVLGIFLFLWMNCNFMAVVLPYLEREPLITYADKNNITYINETLTYEICDEYKYKIIERFGYSWVSEFGIECNKFMVGLIGVFTFIGNTLGSVAFSIVTKYFKHKTILISSSFGFSIAIFVCTLVYSLDKIYIIFTALCFVGLFGNLLCYSSLVVGEEIVSSKKRSLFSSVINTGYGFCGIMYSFIFMYVQNWRYDFYILIGLSLLLGVIIWIFVYESPRIYIDNKDVDNLLYILKGIASFNGKKEEFNEIRNSNDFKKLVTEIMEYNSNEVIEMGDINNNGQNEDNNTALIYKEKENKNEEKITVFSSLKYPSLRYKFLILCIIWFGTRSTSNSISLSCKSFPGNYYFNIIILFAFECVAYNTSAILINIKSLGRKGTLWILYSIIAIIFILLSFVQFSVAFELILDFLARFCAAAIELVYWTYTLEVYPTPVRSLNFGINVTFGNFGSILSPLIYEYLPIWLFLLVFAFLSVFHSILIIYLPETVGKPMVETIDELVNKK